jgi:hypothetical protein
MTGSASVLPWGILGIAGFLLMMVGLRTRNHRPI